VEYVFSSRELLQANRHPSILINHLSDLKTDFLLILDDIHLITNAEILDGLYHFITYIPSNVHLILLTRVEPRLRLTKLALEEDLVSITAEDWLRQDRSSTLRREPES
jgi:LuxR family maltose regulon positive regulatory protein